MKSKISDKLFHTFNYSFFTIFSFMCLYPFVYILALSFNEAIDAQRGGIYFFPRVFTLENYAAVFRNGSIVTAYKVTVIRALLSIVTVLLFNSMFAYALLRRDFSARKFLNWFIIIPMYFVGGLIPFYIVLKYTGLLNNMLTYIIPNIYSTFNILMLRTQFKEVPPSLMESAVIDGANDPVIFFKIILPVNKPVLAAVALFTGVYAWNDWFVGFTFITNTKLWCAQNVMLYILQSNEASTIAFLARKAGIGVKVKVTTESLKMAMLIITVAPILFIYPFMQKYFMKGIMIGSLKE